MRIHARVSGGAVRTGFGEEEEKKKKFAVTSLQIPRLLTAVSSRAISSPTEVWGKVVDFRLSVRGDVGIAETSRGRFNAG